MCIIWLGKRPKPFGGQPLQQQLTGYTADLWSLVPEDTFTCLLKCRHQWAKAVLAKQRWSTQYAAHGFNVVAYLWTLLSNSWLDFILMIKNNAELIPQAFEKVIIQPSSELLPWELQLLKMSIVPRLYLLICSTTWTLPPIVQGDKLSAELFVKR